MPSLSTASKQGLRFLGQWVKLTLKGLQKCKRTQIRVDDRRAKTIRKRKKKEKKMMVAADMKEALFVFITPHFWAGGSHNKTCWVKYLCEINSCDKAVIRDQRGGGIKICGGGGGTHNTREREETHCGRDHRKRSRLWEGNPPGRAPAGCQRSLD